MRPPDLTGNGGVFANVASDANRNRKNATGRYIVQFRDGATREGVEALRDAGLRVEVSNPSDPKVVREDQIGTANVQVSPTLGSATVDCDPGQLSVLQSMANDASSPILRIAPEKVRKKLEVSPNTGSSASDSLMISLSYLKGRRDTYAELVEKFVNNGATRSQTVSTTTITGFDETQVTWGLQATKVIDSPFSGRGVKVAVLDTGIEFSEEKGEREYHSDFKGRVIRATSFVFGVDSPKDGDGHGTHCVGTACGPRRPSVLPGYGVAYDAEIYVGKVLDDTGAGADGWIIAGIEWAINQGCRVVSLSLGSEKEPGDTFNEIYEEIAKRALAAGTLIVAAAGNDSARPNLIRPVQGPADCPSIMAVAAIDADMKIANFSNGGINSSGGEVNIAAPGVNIYSSFRQPPGHERLRGTSMATPHVAGIVALYAEANPSATALELKDVLSRNAQKLSLDQRDVGNGLVQAPVKTEPKPGGDRGGLKLLPVGGVRAQQTSPITIGGGGSVGLDFSKDHYKQSGSGIFVSLQDRLLSCHVVHQDGTLLRNFHSEIEGNQCRIVVACQNTAVGNGTITIAGAPSGPMGVSFSEAAFPATASTRPKHFSATGKVVLITVENVLTGASAPFTVPEDWRGTILINN